jgi:hypothetical protein
MSYALGTLRGPEAAAVEALVRTDRTAGSELAAYHELVDFVALSAPLRRADPSLRDRVLEAARATVHTRVRERFAAWQVLQTIAASAAVVLVVVWGVGVHRQLGEQARANAALAAVVEASAKHIEQLTQAGISVQASESLRTELQTAVADQELMIAIGADPAAQKSSLAATSAGHGAVARFLWSPETNAGLLTARELPDLPLDSVYQLWLDDGKRAYSGGIFGPDERGAVQKVVRLPVGAGTPQRVYVTVAPIGGALNSGPLVVLTGAMEVAR